MTARARPSYPPDAIEFLPTLLPHTTHSKSYKVLDLGAGTGIMTKLLIPHFTVTTVEPVDNMRQKLESLVPEAISLKGTAWSIPLPDASQDMVMLAQCFHWFDDICSLQEIHRVLKPGGVVVLIWNMESKERSEWVARLRALYEVFDGAAPQYRKGYWRNVFDSDDAKQLFELPLKHKRFVFDVSAKREHIWPRILSKSYIAILDQERLNILHQQVEEVLEDPKYQLPKNGSQNEFIYCHDSDMYWCYKK